MLHGDGLRKFSQHPLLEVLKPLVVITTTDKLLVLQREDPLSTAVILSTFKCNVDISVAFNPKVLIKARFCWNFFLQRERGGGVSYLVPANFKIMFSKQVLTLCGWLLRRLGPDGTLTDLYFSCHEGGGVGAAATATNE